MTLSIIIVFCIIIFVLDLVILLSLNQIIPLTNTIIFIFKFVILIGIISVSADNNKYKNNDFYYLVNESLSDLFLELDKYNMCFIGGAICFEDPQGIIFNQLAYDDINNSNCHIDTKLSPSTKLIQTLTHSEFSDKFFAPECKSNTKPSFIIPKSKCINDHFKCNKYERKIYIPNICPQCDDNTEIKRSLLFYPFIDKNKNRYIYLKLESHSTISIGHAKNAIDTYITKTKFGKDSTVCKPRRERLKDFNSWKETGSVIDTEFYNKLSHSNIINQSDLQKINYYNKNIRVGNELFLPFSFYANIFDLK